MACEGFSGMLKGEPIAHNFRHPLQEVRKDVFEYLERFRGPPELGQAGFEVFHFSKTVPDFEVEPFTAPEQE